MTRTADSHVQWISQYFALLPPTRREALAQGVAAFHASQSHAIDAEIAANMTRIHRHPAFMQTYRRYIIVCAEGDERKAGAQGAAVRISFLLVSKAGILMFYIQFEWTTVPQFDFMDEFYPQQTVGGAL